MARPTNPAPAPDGPKGPKRREKRVKRLQSRGAMTPEERQWQDYMHQLSQPGREREKFEVERMLKMGSKAWREECQLAEGKAILARETPEQAEANLNKKFILKHGHMTEKREACGLGGLILSQVLPDDLKEMAACLAFEGAQATQAKYGLTYTELYVLMRQPGFKEMAWQVGVTARQVASNQLAVTITKIIRHVEQQLATKPDFSFVELDLMLTSISCAMERVEQSFYGATALRPSVEKENERVLEISGSVKTEVTTAEMHQDLVRLNDKLCAITEAKLAGETKHGAST